MAYSKKLIMLDDILDYIESALKQNRSFSISRIGHAEMHVMSYKIWPSHNINRYFYGYNEYTGITKLDNKIALRLVKALKKADVVGLGNHTPYNEALLKKIVTRYKLSFPRVCDAWISVQMINSSRFMDLLKSLKVVLIGRRAAEGAEKLKDIGIEVVGSVPHEGFGEIDKTIKTVLSIREFDIVLAAAGVPAAIMCPDIARARGKVALDFGHALDILIDKDGFDFEKLVKDFNENIVTKGAVEDE